MGIDLVPDLEVDLPNLELELELDNSTRRQVCQIWTHAWPLDVSIVVDLPNLNTSWPLDVSTEGSRSAKFELILTTRCQYQRKVDHGGRSRGRSAKFKLISTTRC